MASFSTAARGEERNLTPMRLARSLVAGLALLICVAPARQSTSARSIIPNPSSMRL
jgi:hypothetical protein